MAVPASVNVFGTLNKKKPDTNKNKGGLQKVVNTLASAANTNKNTAKVNETVNNAKPASAGTGSLTPTNYLKDASPVVSTAPTNTAQGTATNRATFNAVDTQQAKNDYIASMTNNSGSGTKKPATSKKPTTDYSVKGDALTNALNTGETNYVKTNTSFGGDFLTVDLNQDYTKLIDAARANGDFASAAVYEAMRNAKINHLNANGGTDLTATNEFIKDYGYVNNQNGMIYTSNKAIKDLANLAPGRYNINGIIYTKDENDNIFQGDRLVGNGMNGNTGEFTFNDINDAKNAYVQQMAGIGVAPAGATYEDLAKQGKVSESYLNALMEGTTNDYNQTIMATVKEDKKDKARAASVAGNTSGESSSLEAEARELAKKGIVYSDLASNGSFENNSKWMQYISGVQGHQFRWGGK